MIRVCSGCCHQDGASLWDQRGLFTGASIYFTEVLVKGWEELVSYTVGL